MTNNRIVSSSLIALTLTVGLAAMGGCKQASSEPSLVTSATGPAGYTWQSTTLASVGAYDSPGGSKWHKDGLGAENEDADITISVQMQGGVEATDRTDFTKLLIDANKRDAPKYEVVNQQEGQVNKIAAARVDGKFDNGKAYATRDYVLFQNHVALAMMVRGPIAMQAEVQAIADHVAASLK
jgi:hypothetical protein